MSNIKRYISLGLVALLLISTCIIGVSAADKEVVDSGADTGIKIHYYSEDNKVPNIYYWNSLPKDITTEYPGPKMKAEGDNWYGYNFSDVSKVNMMFVLNGEQSKELTRNAGEWWYKNDRWYRSNPDTNPVSERGDFREETIYFVMTTRFYDGDTGNNVHCWDDERAGNGDDDPAWRGDFKGLIDKLDYIKALGFSAIWITPVVENASGYDYHGYHAMDFSTVDARYESSGATYQDLIDAIHEKDMKVVQDVVWNHSGNFGEAFLAPMFEKVYDNIKELGDISTMVIREDSKLLKAYPDYHSLDPGAQFQARLAIMKNTDGQNHDTENYYHHGKDMSWESPSEQTGQIAGDCVDINTENQIVADYINGAYLDYVHMGVDSFRMDTTKHINRWTLNNAFFPEYTKIENFFIFNEVCVRVREVWNHGIQSSSVPFFTWKETDSKWIGNWSKTDWKQNYDNSVKHYEAHSSANGAPTSDNAFLKGNNYHTPDYSKANGTSVIDFSMHWNFENAEEAFRAGLAEDKYINDSTWNVMYVDSHDYGPDACQEVRFNFGTAQWAENLNLMFTFRGIPCLYYGSEIEFKKGAVIDVGPGAPLETTGRAYFGDNIEGTVTATDFSEYTASGPVAATLNNPLAKHIQRLNKIRRAIPALQKGQYSTEGVNGNLSYKRRYTNKDEGIDSFACISLKNGATFSGIPNGTYIDAITGDKATVANGTLTVPRCGESNMRVYVLSSGGFTGIDGQIGESGQFLK